MHASKRPAGTLPAHIVHDSGRSKTVCTSAVLIHFGVCAHMYHYSSRPGDVERILRAHGYSVRSRRSKLPKRCSVGQARTKLAGLEEAALGYFVHVDGHAILLGVNGETLVDTDPRERDRRQVMRVYAIFRM